MTDRHEYLSHRASLRIIPSCYAMSQLFPSHVNQERDILISLFFVVKSRFDTPVFMPRRDRQECLSHQEHLSWRFVLLSTIHKTMRFFLTNPPPPPE